MFADRRAAGRQLAAQLAYLRETPDIAPEIVPAIVVVGLPRGGVPVAAEVASFLGAPLDVIIVRKLGVPSQPELAMGAIGEDGVRVINDVVVRQAGVTPQQLLAVEQVEHAELERRSKQFRRGTPRIRLSGTVTIVVDDGIATGSTARAACAVARAHGAARVVLAVPVAPPGWVERMDGAADDYVAIETPTRFRAVGEAYGDFTQTTDAEVVELLRRG